MCCGIKDTEISQGKILYENPLIEILYYPPLVI